jgi:hypothetical protein
VPQGQCGEEENLVLPGIEFVIKKMDVEVTGPVSLTRHSIK